jgi:hypothetical protein
MPTKSTDAPNAAKRKLLLIFAKRNVEAAVTGDLRIARNVKGCRHQNGARKILTKPEWLIVIRGGDLHTELNQKNLRK